MPFTTQTPLFNAEFPKCGPKWWGRNGLQYPERTVYPRFYVSSVCLFCHTAPCEQRTTTYGGLKGVFRFGLQAGSNTENVCCGIGYAWGFREWACAPLAYKGKCRICISHTRRFACFFRIRRRFGQISNPSSQRARPTIHSLCVRCFYRKRY